MRPVVRLLSTVFCITLILLSALTVRVTAADAEPFKEWDVSKSSDGSVMAKLYYVDGCEGKYRLVITGEGKMKSFTAPELVDWYDYSDSIIFAAATAGVKNIGDYSFFDCFELESLTVEGKDTEFPVSSDTLLPYTAEICAHEISTAHTYATLASLEFTSICEFSDGVCVTCGYECTAHTGGTATCTEKAKCEICGTEYGELSEHDLSEVQGRLSDCENDGCIAHLACSACGKCFDGQEKELSSVTVPGGHVFGELSPYVSPTCTEEGFLEHYTCLVCKKHFDANKNALDIVVIQSKGHTGGTATCVSPPLCNVCGESYGFADPSAHSYSAAFTYNSEYHWNECICGDKVNISVHKCTQLTVKEATAEEEGLIKSFCECGYAEYTVIERLSQSGGATAGGTQNEGGDSENTDIVDTGDNGTASETDGNTPTHKRKISTVILSVAIPCVAAAVTVILLKLKPKRKK